MKSKSVFSLVRSGSPAACILAGAIAALLATQAAHAATLTWDVASGDGAVITDGTGIWSDTLGNWNNGTDANWANANPDSASFGSSAGGTLGAAGTVTLGTAITAGSLTFNTALGGGTYIIDTSTLALTLNTGITANESATIQSGAGGSIMLGGGNAWSVASGKTLTVSSSIGGTGFGLTKNGLGILTLSGTNTYDSGTTVSAGTLLTTKAAALPNYGTPGSVIVNGGTLGVQVGGSGWSTGQVDTLLAYATKTSGALGIDTTNGDVNQWTPFTTTNLGALGLTKLGNNTLTLNQANTFTGGVTLNSGTLSLTNNNAIGSNTLTINGGMVSVANNFAFSNNNPFVINNSFTLNSGTAWTTTFGTGMWTLNNNATVTLNLGQSPNVTDPINNNGYNLTLINTQDGGTTISGKITGAGGLTLRNDLTANSKTLTVNNANSTFTGPTILQSSTASNLAIVTSGLTYAGRAGSLGAPTGANAVLQVNNNVIWQPAGATNRSVNLTSNGAGTVQLTVLNANATLDGPIAATGTGAKTLWVNMPFNNAGGLTLTINGAISDPTDGNALTLRVQPGYTNGGNFSQLYLTGVNTFTGPINYDLPTSTPASYNSALNIIGAGQLGAGNYAGNISMNTDVHAILNWGSSANQILGGAITGAGALNKAGAGTLTLSSALNSYTGTTIINGGLLRVTGVTNASSAVTVNATGGLGGNGTVGGTVTAAVGTATTAGGAINLTDSAVGTLSLGSTLTLNGTAAFPNVLALDLGNAAAGTDKIAASGNVTSAGGAVINLNQLAGARISDNTYDLITTSGTMAAASNFSLATTKAFGLSFTNLALDGTSTKLQVTTAQVTSATPAAYWAGGTDVNWNTATNWMTTATSNANTAGAPDYQTNVHFYTTTPTASLLTTNVLNADFDINSLSFDPAATSAVTIGGTKMLTIEAANANGNPAGNGITVSNALPITDTISAKVGLASSQTWTVGTGSALTVSGAVTDFGAGYSLTKAGAGTLTLSGANVAFNGGIALNAGKLVLGNNAALGAGTLTIGSPSGTTAVTLDASAGVTASYNNPQTWNQNFTFIGSNNLTFGTGAVTMAGSRNITVNANTLAEGGMILDGGNNYSITKLGAGALTLSAGNTYGGGTNLYAGSLSINNATAIGTGPLNISAWTTLGGNTTMAGGNAININGSFTYGIANGLNTGTSIVTLGGKYLMTVNNTFTLGGPVVDGGNAYGITKAGTAALTLANSFSTYTGKTIIEAGTLNYSVPLSNAGVAGPLGAPTGANASIDLFPGTSFVYTGGQGGSYSSPLVSTNRTINLAGFTPGTVALNGTNTNDSWFQFAGFTATGTAPRMLQIKCQGDRPVYSYSGGIPDMSDGSQVSLTGTWGSGSSTSNGTIALQGVNTFTGPITLTGGGNAGVAPFLIGGSVSGYVSNVPTIVPGGTGVLGSGNYAGNITFTSGTTGSVLLGYASTATQTLSGVISGPGAVTDFGPGALTLAGANIYTGATNVGSSTQNATLSLTGSLAGTAITVNGASVLSESSTGVISGASSITHSSSAISTLAGANTYSGATTISAGTLKLSNQYALRNSTLTMGGGATAAVVFDSSVIGNAFTLGGLSATAAGTGYDIALQNNAGSPAAIALSVGNNNTNTTYACVLSQSGSLTKVGAGTLTLSGANSYTGGTNVTGGTLFWSGTNNLPASGTLQVNAGGNFSLADGTARSTSTAALNLASGATVTFDWNAGAVDTLTSTAAATTTTGSVIGISINPTNTPTGSGLTLLGAPSGLLTGTTAYFLANNTNYTATLTQSDTGVSIGAYSAVTAPTLLFWQGNKVAGANTSGVDNAWALSAAASNWSTAVGTYTATPVVPGATADVIFSTTSTPTQQTSVLGADMTLKSVTFNDSTAVTIGGSNALTLTSTVATAGTGTAGGGSAITVLAAAANPTVSANVVLGAAQTWNVATGKTLNVSGVVSGASANSLTIGSTGNAGTVLLSGANNYTGGTTIGFGTLQIGNASALGSDAGSASVTSGAVLDLNGITMTVANPLTLNGTGISSGGALINSSATAATYSGPLKLGSASSIIAGSGNIILSYAGPISGTSNPALTVGGAFNTTINGNIATGSGALTKNGAGTLTLTGANTFTGGTTISANAGTLKLSNQYALQNSALTLNSGTGALVFDSAVTSNAFIVGGLNATAAGAGFDISLQNSASTNIALTVGMGNANSTYAGNLTNGSSLTKVGTGSLTLSGTNTYGGNTTLGGGTLQINATASLPSASTLVINYGTTFSPGADGLTLSNSEIWNGDFSFGGGKQNITLGNVTLGSSVIVTNGSINGNLNVGTINDGSNGYGLTFAGSKNFTLTGTNTYTGPTNITGTATMALTGKLSTSSAITVFTGATLALGNVVQGTDFASNISGYGAVSINGGTTAVLHGANSYTGGTTVVTGNDGRLYFDNDNSLGTGTITFNSNTFRGFGSVDATAHTLANPISLASTTSVNSRFGKGGSASGGTGNLNFTGPVSISSATAYIGVTDATILTFSGPVSSTGTYGITKDDTGTLALSGDNIYTGATTVSGGTLLVNNTTGSGTGTGAVSVGASGTLGGTGTIAGAVNVTGVLSPGASIGTLTSGALTFNNGSFYNYQVNSSVSPTVGADLHIVNGALALNGTVTLNLADLGTGTFAPGTVFSLFKYSAGLWNGGLLTYNSTALAEDATFNFAGKTWTIDYDATTKGANVAGTQSDNYVNISIPGVALTPYQQWAQTNITAIQPLADATPGGDPDHDGVTNLTEFAFNGNPLSGTDRGFIFGLTADSSADPETVLKEIILTVAVRKTAPAFTTGSPSTSTVDGINYSIEGSTDLTSWTVVVTPVTPITTGLPALTDPTNYEYRSFSLNGSNGLPGKGFLRAKVEMP